MTACRSDAEGTRGTSLARMRSACSCGAPDRRPPPLVLVLLFRKGFTDARQTTGSSARLVKSDASTASAECDSSYGKAAHAARSFFAISCLLFERVAWQT